MPNAKNQPGLQDTVFLRAGLTYENPDRLTCAVEQVFALSGQAALLGPHSRVLLKPNLLAKHTPAQGVTTHPAVVTAVIRALKKRGVTNITLADSSGGVYTEASMDSIYRASGLAAVCEAEGVRLWPGIDSGPRKADGVLVHEFNLLAPVLESDFIIDLPKVKSHVMTGMTCAVKNIFGCIPGLQKAELHMRFPDRAQFGQMLCDLYETVAPKLVIADGIIGMEGDGPAGGSVREMGILLGGEDGFAVDLAAAKLIGMDPAQVPYLAAGMAAGRCAARFDDAKLALGSDPLVPIEDFVLPASFAAINFQNRAPRFLRWAMPAATRFAAPHPVIRRAKCVGCGKCAEICPGHTISLANRKAYIDPAGCIRCFCCHEMCPAKAIDVRGLPFFKL